MISFEEAHRLVLSQIQPAPSETIDLAQAIGRVLAEEVRTDRPSPPYDRATHDGIVISRGAINQSINRFRIAGTIAAGAHPPTLHVDTDCWEIMTGAMLPAEAGAVVRYEDISQQAGYAGFSVKPALNQLIERAGSQRAAHEVVIQPGRRMVAADIGALATVGKVKVAVRQLPRTAVLTTGDELVDVRQTPQPYQIRKSNGDTLRAALQREGITATVGHLADDKDKIANTLNMMLSEHDALLLSGGVSRGKYDFLPEVLEQLGVQRVFHRVAQKPGKPLWFGRHPNTNTTVFSFPGNPVSTWAGYTAYFLPWLHATLGLPNPTSEAVLSEDFINDTPLTRLVPIQLTNQRGVHYVRPVAIRGSGDLFGLVGTTGLIVVPPTTQQRAGAVVTVRLS